VYGEQSSTTEETAPRPINPYGASKLAAEQEIVRWANEDKSRTAIILRPTVVFGPHSKANIFRLIRQVCDGRFLMVGSGKNIKSIVYVKNLVDATIYLKDKCQAGLHILIIPMNLICRQKNSSNSLDQLRDGSQKSFIFHYS